MIIYNVTLNGEKKKAIDKESLLKEMWEMEQDQLDISGGINYEIMWNAIKKMLEPTTNKEKTK